MRVAALYDVHGNLPALEAVLNEVSTAAVDEIVVGGDVLWGPLQVECVALLRDVDATFVRGNCERNVLAPETDTDRWCRSWIDDRMGAVVSSWPLTETRELGVGTVVFCHATPRDDEEILTGLTPADAIRETLEGVEADVVVCGHTHVQFDRAVTGAPRLVNAGAVGLPYEGRPGACWALLGDEIELRRTTYDVEAALARLREVGFPGFDDLFPGALTGATTADEATAHFESRRGA